MDIQNKKPAIKQLVLDLRRALEKELAIVLKQYGLQTDRQWPLDAPPERLTDEKDRETWRRIVAVIRRGLKEGRSLPEASQDYVRESAFTFLNRLVGLKCLEVRGLIDEVITTRDIYGGRSQFHRDYRDDYPREARAADDALPAALAEACRRVNQDLIGYLFDPDDDHSLVWPRYAVLKSCIEKINGLEEWIWAEDEIIGWIYQFYNAEEKRAVRDRGKPNTPHEVAVINQFFTPRWVVKFLVDNTLGRLWLEMHPDSPRVREKCDYLVPELLSVEDGDESYTLDLDSPLNNPQAAPRRDEKPITQIKLLDPACGTMHFGHYACEVFEAMYKDARDRGEVQIEDGRIPGAILECNLFGVDIDRRAVQLAALSLLMKARTMHPDTQVKQVNLVVADATLPNSGVKKKFLDRYARTPKVQRAFAQVLDEMDQVAQLGSLLRVEERLRELLVQVGHASINEFDPRRLQELPGFAGPAHQMVLGETATKEPSAEWTPDYSLQELRDDLRQFARQALQEHEVNAQLFATEADKAVRLLDVLMGEYDVVVMNPPYGDAIDWSIVPEASEANKNFYCAFLLRARTLLSRNGYVGALTDRTYLLLNSYDEFRTLILHKMPILSGVDLGWGVLDDANVATIAAVFSSDKETKQATFIRCLDAEEKEKCFQRELENLVDGSQGIHTFVVSLSDFEIIPTHPFCYWAPSKIRKAFKTYKKLEPGYGIVRKGLSPGNTPRFVRYHWEVQADRVGMHWWAPYANGGAFSPYYRDNPSVVLWWNDGEAIKSIRPRSVIRSEKLYGKSGLTYGKRHHFFNVQVLEQHHVFSNEGYIIRCKNKYNQIQLLGLLNSTLMRFVINLISGLHKEVTSVKNLPIPEDALVETHEQLQYAHKAYNLKSTWDTGNEISTHFSTPWLLQLIDTDSDAFQTGLGEESKLLGWQGLTYPFTLEAMLAELEDIEQAADAKLQQFQAQIDEAVYDLYEITASDRQPIEQELGKRPPELVWPQMEGKSKKEKRREHVRRFFSYFALQAVRQDDDGIVPLAGRAARGGNLVDRVRRMLEAQFGPEIAYQLEQDAADYLGRSLEEWLHRYFFHHFHIHLYKKRPILWHLTSPRGYFAVLLDYHRLTRDTLPRIKMLYLWPQIEEVSSRLNTARLEEVPIATIAALEEEQADLEAFSKQISQLIDNGYDPDIDDGVKVNLLPIQEAGLLPVSRVV